MMRGMQIVVTLFTLSGAAEQSSCSDTASDAMHSAAMLQVGSRTAPLILASGISSGKANLKEVSSSQPDHKKLTPVNQRHLAINVLQKMRPRAKQSKLKSWLSMVSSQEATGRLTCIPNALQKQRSAELRFLQKRVRKADAAPKVDANFTVDGAATSETKGSFCAAQLYTDQVVCDDGSPVQSNGCCAATDSCPSSCMSWGTGTNAGGKYCTCNGCNYGLKLPLADDERYLKATNYFRCRHGQPLLVWDSAVSSNAQEWADTCASQAGNPAHTRPDGSNSYALTPSSGENVAAGHQSPEAAVEAWYDEITDPGYTPGGGFQSGTGHYTALIWKSTTKLGCGQSACASGSPAPVHVCHYADSPGNMGGQYEANVPQSNTPTETEEACCATIYGEPVATAAPTDEPATTAEPYTTAEPTDESATTAEPYTTAEPPAENDGSNEGAVSPVDTRRSSDAMQGGSGPDAASSPADNAGSNDAAPSPADNGGSNDAETYETYTGIIEAEMSTVNANELLANLSNAKAAFASAIELGLSLQTSNLAYNISIAKVYLNGEEVQGDSLNSPSSDMSSTSSDIATLKMVWELTIEKKSEAVDTEGEKKSEAVEEVEKKLAAGEATSKDTLQTACRAAGCPGVTITSVPRCGGAPSSAANGGSNDAAPSSAASGGDNATSGNDGLNDGALVRPDGQAPHLTDPSQVIIGSTPNSLTSSCKANSLTVFIVSNIGFSIGARIVIDFGTDIEEWNIIVGFGSLILETPLKYDHGPGALVNLATDVTSGASASLDAAGFSAVSSLCCPSEMETFFNRLLGSLGYFVCSKPHLQGLMHWFHCVPNMDFQYVLDVIHNGNPCMYWAKDGETCPVLSEECAGKWCR